MSDFHYRHEHGDAIIESALKFFDYSESAQALLKSLEDQPYKILHMTGPISQCFVPNRRTIMMRIPALYDTAKIEQAIDLAGGLAELSILRKSGSVKANTLETEDHVAKQHFKNLDLILKTFEIVRDWDDAGYKASLEIFRMGLRSLYKPWKKGKEYEGLSEIYWQIMAD